MKFTVITQGCKINIFDSEVIKKQLLDDNFTYTNNNEEANLFIVNSCTVTEKADRKFRQIISKIKRENPSSIIAAVGCLSQLNSEKLKDLGIDIILGSDNKFTLPEMIREFRKANTQIINTENIDSFHDYHLDNYQHTRAFLKIQDGCDNGCTYCTIKNARGKSKSKSFSSVITDIKNLKEKGYREVIISGIDLGSYFSLEKGVEYRLKDLLREIVKIDGFRIRLGSIEPWCFDDELIDLLVNNSRICPHFHVSLQSASDKILKLMKRKYRMNKFETILTKLAQKKGVMISTDMIVGFPMESEEDFQESVDFLKNSALSYAHVFTYSDRPHALSSKIYPKVHNRIKNERSKILREVSEKKKRSFYQKFLGKKLSVIIETVKERENGEFLSSGYSENYIPVSVHTTDKITKNSLLKVKIVEVLEDKVLGKIVK